ncbi:MAG: MmcQ/YjbR family DNA-binding protein [Dehalococcoidia bacterium]|nr:MmcQ/YjbR family DNA-binding protein [Dehalococcoidia bacterium]
MAEDAQDRMRAICLEFPEVNERAGWRLSFEVRGKNFASLMDDHHGDGRLAIWCKADRDTQAALVEVDANRFFVPPYVGPSGWVGIRLDVSDVDWDEVAELLEDGYRLLAPRRLVAQLDGR